MTKRNRLLISLGMVLVSVIIILLIVGRPEPGPKWVQTDKEQYLTGEEVTIYLTNLTDEPLQVGKWGIFRGNELVFYILFDEGGDLQVDSWDTEELQSGAAVARTWNQTYYSPVVSGDLYHNQVPPGIYTVRWRPYEQGLGAQRRQTIGPFTYEFEILDRIRDNGS